MKLEFDPTNLDEVQEVKGILSHGRLHAALDDIYRLTRNFLKYEDTANTQKAIELINQIKQIAAQNVFQDED